MYSEEQRPPIEDDAGVSAEVLRVDFRAKNRLKKTLPNYDAWQELFSPDLSKGNLDEEKYRHCEKILENATKIISMGSRHGRDLSYYLNTLATLFYGKIGLSGSRNMARIWAAKTIRQEISKSSDERIATQDESAQKRGGLKQKLFGRFGGGEQ